jgi:zinc D-Ala-D-Ala dipeptidase
MKPATHRICIAWVFGLLLLMAACSVPEEYSNAPKAKKPFNDSVTPDTLLALSTEPEQPKGTPGEIEQKFIDANLVDVQSLNPNIRAELKYSTKNNFAHADVYGSLTRCYLRKEAADKLVRAQEILETKKPGWHLLCYDCARPRSVQKELWDSLKIPNKASYLSHPGKGSMHNYGIAVDLTISDEKGKPIDMGTDFDFFGDKAQPQKEAKFLAKGELTQAQIDNRLLLRQTMREARFGMIVTEWWHFVAFGDSTVTSRFRIIE